MGAVCWALWPGLWAQECWPAWLHALPNPSSCTRSAATLAVLPPNEVTFCWYLLSFCPEGWRDGEGMLLESLSSFPSIQQEESFLNLKTDEGKQEGAGQEEIMSHISSVLSKMSSIWRCIIILYTTKKGKNADTLLMIMPSIKRLVPISEMLKYRDKNVHLSVLNSRTSQGWPLWLVRWGRHHFTSLCLGFLIYKMGIGKAPPHTVVTRIKY